MPLYKYIAKLGINKTVEGNFEASSQDEAIEKINELGYTPVRIKEVKAQAVSKAKEKNKPVSKPSVVRKIKSHDITIFSRQLASFLKSGMPILEALNIMSEQSNNRNLQDIFKKVASEVKDGKMLSVALSKYPKVFPPLYIAMIRTGEDSGTLPEVLSGVADHKQKQEEFASRVRMALVYPALMVFVAIATIVFMFIFVMPRLTKVFYKMGVELPEITKVLISTSKFLSSSWPWILAGVGALCFIIRQRSRSKKGALAFNRFKLKLPVLGELAIKSDLARFSRTLGLLIKNGIPILKAIKIVIPTLNNEIIRQELVQGSDALKQGASFGKSLKRSTLFPAFMSNLIIMGEKSGRLEEILSEIADSYEKEVDEAMKMFATLLEPMVIIIMGLVVGVMVIAMLLPVFQINIMVR